MEEERLSPSSVRQILKNQGLYARKRPKKWIISAINKKKRVSWAKEMLNLEDADWRKVVFTDESMFSKGQGPKYARCLTANQVMNKFPVLTSRWGPTCHVWGAITCDGIFALRFLNENVNGITYTDLIKNVTPPIIDELKSGELYFQQDNAPAHRSRIATEYFQNEGIRLIPWPPQSPDLNLIENVWQLIKRRLKPAYETKAELQSHIVKEWADVEVAYVRKLYAGMRNRLTAVIKEKGGPTKY